MLEVKNISCQKGYTLLFQNLEFYLKSGDIARVMGDNGSGKTSLLKILAGIHSSDTGTITLNNYAWCSDEYKEHILYLGHNSLIAPQLSVQENITFLAQLSHITYTNDMFDNALSSLGLKHYRDALCYTLSAGQKRKVILALLFMSKATLWLLDEPFTALDVKSVGLLEDAILQHCNNGGMCILTTHQQSRLVVQEIEL
jgi:heme exporter protein A